MKYVGSKNRHAKHILPIILNGRKKDQWYVEPFVGGFNLIDKVKGNRIGNDKHTYLIALFQAIKGGWIPPSNVSNEEYLKIKQYPDKYSKALVGFVGFGCSFAGKWWGGYARGKDNKGNDRNYALESKKNLLRQAPNIKDVEITNWDFYCCDIPNNSIVYCDPPYQNTVKYKDSINYKFFWQWCRGIAIEYNAKVFVSEYKAPEDFKCVWKKEVLNTLDLNTGSKVGMECLFQYLG